MKNDLSEGAFSNIDLLRDAELDTVCGGQTGNPWTDALFWFAVEKVVEKAVEKAVEGAKAFANYVVQHPEHATAGVQYGLH